MACYYNDNDPKAAAWLRELIRCGHIAHGDVDERSIVDVEPGDLAGYAQCHFFAGIGGWSYALRLAGWPDDRPVWTGSCPCQPFSAAGKGLAEADERHLWPDFARLIAQCSPSVVFGEQVASKAGREWLAGVRLDLESVGYAVGAADLCAAGVGAPHIRQRLYWVADAPSSRRDGSIGESERTSRDEARMLLSGADGATGRLAHAGYEQSWRSTDAGQAQSGGPFGDATGCSATGGMADTEHPERRPISGPEQNEFDRSNAGWQEAHGIARACGEIRRLGDSVKPGLERLSGHGDDWRESGWLCPTQGRSTAEASGWSDFDILYCTDGKARRIESGTFPLAHGIPARMGRLRGYGNAIVPQVAAEFIMAWQNSCS